MLMGSPMGVRLCAPEGPNFLSFIA